MAKHAHSQSADEVLDYACRVAKALPEDASRAMFYFLYKEILVNRMDIIESSPNPNRAAMEHTEKEINELNIKLAEQLKR